MFTQEELEKSGWEKMSWNNGLIIEMRKSLRVKTSEIDRAYIVVVFYKLEPNPGPRVEIVAGQSRLNCPYIETIERLNLLYELLADPALLSVEAENG